jgi:hypothetical protein
MGLIDWIKSPGVGKAIRNISLVIVIVFGAVFCGILWYATFFQNGYMWIPAAGFTTIYAVVLIFEVIGATTGYKKTLSTRYNHWTKEHPVLSLVSIICFLIAMFALAPHFLAAW